MKQHKAALALLLALLATSQAAAAAELPSAAAVRRSLLSSSPSVGPIYSNGNLEWRSWSWGLSSLNVRDAGKPMPGARAALCLAIQPFGALSLRSSVPFSLEGALGFYIRGNGNSSAAQLGGLEMQASGGCSTGRGKEVPAGAPCPPCRWSAALPAPTLHC